MSRLVRDLKRFWRGLNGGRIVITTGVIIAIIVWLVVPTGTPDDAITSLPLYLWLGQDDFILLVAGAVALGLAYEKRWI